MFRSLGRQLFYLALGLYLVLSVVFVVGFALTTINLIPGGLTVALIAIGLGTLYGLNRFGQFVWLLVTHGTGRWDWQNAESIDLQQQRKAA